jgi:hypothetical protein
MANTKEKVVKKYDLKLNPSSAVYSKELKQEFVQKVANGDFGQNSEAGLLWIYEQTFDGETGRIPSSSTPVYWCRNEEYRQNIRDKSTNLHYARGWERLLEKNIHRFCNAPLDKSYRSLPLSQSREAITRSTTYLWRAMSRRIVKFCIKGTGKKDIMANATFTFKQLLDQTLNYDAEKGTFTCRYTGDTLHLTDSVHHLDHIDPKGGNGLENCVIVSEMANLSKNSMAEEESYDHYEKILRNKRPELFRSPL